jgi:hypothetical protein
MDKFSSIEFWGLVIGGCSTPSISQINLHNLAGTAVLQSSQEGIQRGGGLEFLELSLPRVRAFGEGRITGIRKMAVQAYPIGEEDV